MGKVEVTINSVDLGGTRNVEDPIDQIELLCKAIVHADQRQGWEIHADQRQGWEIRAVKALILELASTGEDAMGVALATGAVLAVEGGITLEHASGFLSESFRISKDRGLEVLS